MNKSMKIVMIIILLILAILVTSFMIYALINNKNPFWDFSGQSVLLLDQTYEKDIKNINIEAVSADIYIKEAEDEQIHVLIYGSEKENAESTIDGESLNISKKGKIFCFGFCFQKTEIIVYIPKNKKLNLNIKTISGDIEISSNQANVEIKTTSGDIKTEEIKDAKITTTSGDILVTKANKLEVGTTSGSINVDKIENSIEAKSVSGDIKINSFEIKENSHIKTVSGDVLINEISDVFIETSTTSGDVNVSNNNQKSSQTLTIRTTSGDIRTR